MFVKKCYAAFLKCIALLMGEHNAKRFDSALRFHRKLNLKSPRTLADKVCWIELYDQSPLAVKCTDKFAVREYITSKGLAHILVELVGGPWNSEVDIDFSILPHSFVLKATHGCKMNIIVPDKTQIDVVQCKKEMHKWMKTTYGTYSVEPHYFSIPHRLYAEKYLENAQNLVDYKIHCFNGVPQFVLVCSNRKSDEHKGMQVTLDIFDMDWNSISGLKRVGNEIPGNGDLKKPGRFSEMCAIAKTLSEDFKFVRVDLYELNGKVLFGELTFTPACGVFPYFTDQFNEKMGSELQV